MRINFRTVDGVITESTEGLKITGVALIPRTSKNEIHYTKGEIRRADGKTVDVNWEHNVPGRTPDTLMNINIGKALYTWNSYMEHLEYEAIITNIQAIEMLREMIASYVSIEANIEDSRRVCNKIEGDCFNMPSGLDFVGLAITSDPGIPESSLNIVTENSESVKKAYMLKWRTPGMAAKPAQETAATPAPLPEGFEVRNGIPVPVSEAAKAALVKELTDPGNPGVSTEKPSAPCPPGQISDGENCVAPPNTESGNGDKPKPDEEEADGDDEKPKNDDEESCTACAAKEAAKKAAAAAAAAESARSGHGMPNMDEVNKKITALEAEVKKAASREAFDEHLYSVATIGIGESGAADEDIKALTARGWAALESTGHFRWKQDTAKWITERAPLANDRGEMQNKKLTEAIQYTNGGDLGDRRSVVARTGLRPGGRYLKSIRDMVRFYEVPQGTTSITLPIGDIAEVRALTEGPTGNSYTNPHNVEIVTLSVPDVTGQVEFVPKSQIEDSPQSLFEYMTESARGGVLDYESRLVFKTVADAIPANRIGGWLNGAGDNITTDDADDLGSFGFEALVNIVAEYQDAGYDTSMGAIKCVLPPKMLAQLKKDSDIQRYVQEGDAMISRTGDLSYFQGVELIPMNSLKTVGTAGSRTNDAYRATCFVDQWSFVLATKRNQTIDIQQRPNLQGYDWAWSQRKAAVSYDTRSVFRISAAIPS